MTRSGLVEGCDADVLQMPITDSTLGLSELIRLVGRPVVGIVGVLVDRLDLVSRADGEERLGRRRRERHDALGGVALAAAPATARCERVARGRHEEREQRTGGT